MSTQEGISEYTIDDHTDIPEDEIMIEEIMLIKSCLGEIMVEVLKIVGKDEL